jgi:hypothetical protein
VRAAGTLFSLQSFNFNNSEYNSGERKEALESLGSSIGLLRKRDKTKQSDLGNHLWSRQVHA